MNAQNSRRVIERIFITGTLLLETPAHFGNGDADALTDVPLLRDPFAGNPLLTGASIAGALRNYLREIELGFGKTENQDGKTRVEKLFGHLDAQREDKASVQSWLIVDDALGSSAGIELRDGVAIEPQTRTAEEHKKFDVELLTAGTTFALGFEVLLTQQNQDLLGEFVRALQGFEQGEIGLGQRKRRGYGQCRVSEWRVRRYAVNTPSGLIAWLNNDASVEQRGEKIAALLPAKSSLPDARKTMRLTGTFGLDGSILIRSGSGIGSAADMVHLRSTRNGKAKPAPILSGTSLAGVIRGRAWRIAKTIVPAKATGLVDVMFGKRITGNTDKPSGSRVSVTETEIEKFLEPELVQSRVKLDRFTGGAYPQALFSEQPVFGTPDTQIKIALELKNPKLAEVGLLLLVLKDLWTGDLPLGGESSVGRGRMSGICATLEYDSQTWEFTQKGAQIEIKGNASALESFVSALKEAQ